MPHRGYPAVALSRQRCLESERDSGPVVRCARVAAALVAVLAVRALFSGSEHAARLHIATPWILIAVALGAGVMLREAGRGLVVQLPRPRWSARFLGTWAGSSGLLLTVLLASGSSLGSGVWISIRVRCLPWTRAGRVAAWSTPAAAVIDAATRSTPSAPPRVRGPCPVCLDADRVGPSAAAGRLVRPRATAASQLTAV